VENVKCIVKCIVLFQETCAMHNNLAINNSIRHKVYKNIKKFLFSYFYQIVGVQQEINIVYFQFVKIRLQPLHFHVL